MKGTEIFLEGDKSTEIYKQAQKERLHKQIADLENQIKHVRSSKTLNRDTARQIEQIRIQIKRKRDEINRLTSQEKQIKTA